MSTGHGGIQARPTQEINQGPADWGGIDFFGRNYSIRRCVRKRTGAHFATNSFDVFRSSLGTHDP
jgi:hypothetical protein